MSFFEKRQKKSLIKGNSKGLWRQLKSIGYSFKSKNNCKIVLNINNESCSDPTSIVEYINKYFLNVPIKLVSMLPFASQIFSTCSDLFKLFYSNNNISPNQFSLHNVSEIFVNNELAKLNPNKSYGVDGIQARFIKDCI